METIFAVSSGRPPAAIAVMRISGPAARAAGETLAGALPLPRLAGLRRLHDTAGDTIDRALCLWFPGPDTVTGEDLLELHLHGGRAVIAAVEARLAELPGLRPAAPGEFTRRALLAGRIDLAEAQGLADLLEAETEQQRRAAVAASEGRLSTMIRDWLARLSVLGATIEAALDFDDEDDIAPIDMAALEANWSELANEWRAMLDRPTVERFRDGVRIALGGAPNVGKSSLFNALIEREAAIVSPVAGTTRDVIEASVVRGGRVYTLIDTAGLRGVEDPIERIGIERARQAHESADLVLALDDDVGGDNATLRVFPKIDLAGVRAPVGSIGVSINDSATIDALWAAIERRTATLFPVDRALLHHNQRDAVEIAWCWFEEAATSRDLLIRAESVRRATKTIATILGVDATEAMLDALFARFCVGK